MKKLSTVFKFVLPVLLVVGFLFSGAAYVLANITTNSVTVDGSASTTVAPSATVSISVNGTVTSSGTNDWRGTNYRVSTTSGTFSCADTGNHSIFSGSSSFTESFNVTAPSTPGTYNVYVALDENSDCSGNNGNTVTLTNAIIVKTGTTASITSDSPDPSTVGQAYTVNISVTRASGSSTPSGTVTVSDGTDSCNDTTASGSGATVTYSCNLTSTTTGAKTLTATYAGDSNFAGSSDTESHTVNVAPTPIPFTETFGTSDTGTVAGWIETGTTDIFGQSGAGDDQTRDSTSSNKFARIEDNGSICRTFDASDDSNLFLSYYWKGDKDAENVDFGVVEYKLGDCVSGSWSSVNSHPLDDTSSTGDITNVSWNPQVLFDLPGSLDGQIFSIRFSTNANQPDEHFRVDDVVINSFGHIVVDKVTNPSGSLQSFDFDAVGGSYADFSLTDASTPNDQTLAPGNYSVSETPVGYWGSDAVCVSSIGDTETIGALELDAGETITCTFTNTHPGDLVAVKTNDVSGNVIYNTPFNWTITISNIEIGTVNISDTQDILEDNLPTGATYGTPVAVNGGGTTGTVNCAIAANVLDCDASGAVVVPPSGTITVTIPVTPTATGSLVNPTGGQCVADPDFVIAETIQGNNFCADTVNVAPADQTTLVVTGLPASATYAQAGITAGTSGGSGTGAVTFSAGASTACTVDTNTGAVTITSGTGTCSITATKAADTNYNATTSAPVSITINKANAVIDVDGYSVTYDGNSHTATGTATGVNAEDLSGLLTLSGTTHTNAGSYPTDPWSFAGDANYNTDAGTVSDSIAQASSTVTVTCPDVTYTGSTQTPCTGSVTGNNLSLDVSASLSYLNNTNAGTESASASYTFGGDANHTGNSGSDTFSILKDDTTTTITGVNLGTPTTVGGSYTVSWEVTSTLGGTPTGTVTVTGGSECTAAVELGQCEITSTEAGVKTLVATYSGDDNLNGSVSAGVSHTVDKAVLTITANYKTITYGDADPVFNFSTTGFVSGVNDEIDTPPTCDAEVHHNADTYTITCSGADDADYTFTYVPGTLTIDQLPITVTAVTDTKVYDGDNSSDETPTINITLPYSDSANFTQTFDDASVATGKTLTASGTVTDGNGGGNYDYTFVTDITGEIIGFALNASITAEDKVYDSTDDATITSCDLTGVIGSDDVSCSADNAHFDDANAGDGKTVTADISLTGADAGNYTVNSTASTTADITKATATVTATASDKTYDGNTTASVTLDVTGEVGSDVLGATYVSADFDTAAAGINKTVTVLDIALTGTNAGNYSFNDTDTDLADITAADATCTVSGYTGVYDAVSHGASGSCTGVEGTLAGLTLGASYTNVPGGNAHWDFTNPNYAHEEGDVAITISKANASITVNGYDVTYDTTEHSATGSALGVLGETLAGLDLSGTAHTNVGNYTDAWIFTDVTGNYNDDNDTVNDKISAASASIDITDISFTYDGTPKPVTVTTTPSGLAYSLSYDGSGTAPTNAGSYPVVATITDPNYSGSDSDTLVIAKADSVTDVTCPNPTEVYTGSAIEPCGVSITGAGSLSISTLPSYSNNVNVGTATASYTYGGDANHNGSDDSATFDITGAEATCTINGFTGPYDGSPHGATGSCTGIEGTLSGLTLGASFTNVPGGTANWSFSNANYASQSGSVSIVISKVTPTATLIVTNSPVTYDGSAHSALVSVDTSSVPGSVANTLTGGAADQTDADTYAVLADFVPTDTTNYNTLVGLSAGNFVIGSADANIIVSNTTQTYDGTPKSVTVTAPSTFTVTYDGFATVPTDAGSYAVHVESTDSNYAGTADTTLVINKADSVTTVTCPNDTETYTGSPIAPCLASVTGAGSLSLNPSPSYTANTNVGLVTASYNYGGDANHNGSTGSDTFEIVSTSASIDITDISFTYDGTPKPVTVTTTPSGLAYSLSYDGSGTAPTNAGSYPVVATITDPNYSGSDSDTLVIAKANPVITWADPADIESGTALSGTQLNASANVGGVFTYIPASGTVLSVGAGQNLHVDFVPTDTTNYNNASDDALINVVDTTGPDTSITSTPLNPSASSSATFTFTSTESGTFECSLDGAIYSPCVTPITYNSLSEDTHTFGVRAKDGQGNTDLTPATYTWVVDAVGPVITIEDASAPTETSILVTWTTDHPSTSKVVYDTVSHDPAGSAPTYGYAFATTEDSNLVTNHSVNVTGLSSNTTYYFRGVSHGSPESISNEVSETTLIPTVNPACNDGEDNDGDTLVDYPADPGCVDANDNDEINEIVVPPTHVHVTIAKFIDGTHATAENAGSATFTMQADYSFTNEAFPGGISGSDPYTLSTVGSLTDNAYEAKTLEFYTGANYATHEHIDQVVGTSCESGTPFAFVGYSVGDTYEAAVSASVSTTVPSFTNLQNNKFVIVHNHKCGDEQPPIENTCPVPSTLGDETLENIQSAPGAELDLQEVLDGASYSLNAQADQTQYQVWNVTPNSTVNINSKFVNKFAGKNSVFGYYTDSSMTNFVPVFKTANITGYESVPMYSAGPFSISVGDASTIGFAIKSFNGSTGAGDFATEKSLNTGSKDQVIVYNPSSNKYVLAFEDLYGGDDDFNDLVVEVTLSCDTVPPPTDTGSITVCKVILDAEGNVITGNPGSTFTIPGLTPNPVTSQGAPVGQIGNSVFNTSLSWNASLLSGEALDAQCVTYSNLALGGYYYGEETISDDANWVAPKYNDQNSVNINTVADFFSYSGELFNGNAGDDEARNQNADGHIVLTADRPERTLVVLNQMEEVQVPPTTATINATKIVCDSETDLPNWGGGAANITENTAQNFLNTHPNCHQEDWTFEWAPANAVNPGNQIGVAGGAWTAFSGGVAVIPAGARVWVREQFDNNYIPFSGDITDPRDQDVSAELYCSNDVLNYDNYDYVDPVIAGETYNCVGFNVPIEIPEEICTDEEATNFGETAPCEYPEPEVCTDDSADNFGGPLPCTYPEVPVPTVTKHKSHHSGGGTPQGQVLGAQDAVCTLGIDTYMRKGYKNNSEEVKILQNFLNGHMNSGLVVDGVFGGKTEAAVKAFQLKYASDILTPWGNTVPTGIVYKTTLVKIKNLMCPVTILPIPTDLVNWSQNPAQVPPQA